MIWVVVAEAVAVVVLALVVVALTHSYAGLASRLEDLGHGDAPRRARPDALFAPRPPGEVDGTAAIMDVAGVTPTGEEVVLPVVGVDRDTLLAFLTSTCTSCQHLWDDLRGTALGVVPPGLRLIVVAKGPDRESPSAIQALAPRDVDVVLSSDAWTDFKVPGSPYFVLVRGEDGSIAGEGTAMSWPQVLDLMGVAVGDADHGWAAERDGRKPRRDLEREAEVDRLLLTAGVLPGDDSLYPPTRTEAT